MKKLTRIIIAVLSLILAFCFFGCSAKGCNNKKDKAAEVEQPVYEDGTHDIIVGTTDVDLLRSGATDYKIVISDEANDYERSAASEIALFFHRATQADLPVISDAQAAYSSDAKYISVGNTSLLTQSGVVADYATLGESGYVIKTVGNSVYLASSGRVGFGTVYSAYEFLHHTVGYEAYGPDSIYTDTGVRNLKLPAFDITDVPDFEWRMVTFGQLEGRMTESNRMRLNLRTNGSVMVSVNGNTTHTMQDIMHPDTYYEDNNDWFDEKVDQYGHRQVCYTARGNKERYDALVDETVKQSKIWIDAYPDATYFMLGMADNGFWCSCTACSASKQTYGVDSAVYIKFVNDCAAKIEEWLNSERDGRKLTVGMFAYNKVTEAPASLGEDGKYHPIDDSVVLRDNVTVLYAPIQADFTKSFYEDKKGFDGITQAWNACTSKLSLWMYQAYFNEMFVPYDNFGSMQENYIYAKEHGVFWLFDQGQQRNNQSSGFNNLKIYLNSKLQWNINQDVNELTRNYFMHEYGDAAESMLALYDSLRAYYTSLEASGEVTGYIYQTMRTSELWQKGTLDGFLRRIDAAYAAIEHLRETDSALYTTIYDKICLESLSYRYLLISLYGGRYGNSELFDMKQRFKADTTRLGINQYNELIPGMADLWSSWGI